LPGSQNPKEGGDKSPEMTPEQQQAATDKLIAEMMAAEGGDQFYQGGNDEHIAQSMQDSYNNHSDM